MGTQAELEPHNAALAEQAAHEDAEAARQSADEAGFALDADLGIVARTGEHEGLTWRPSTLADVDWILERMGQLDAEAAENQTMADAATQRILERLDRANGRLKRQRDYLEGLASAYAREHRKEIVPGKKKSRELPNGELCWRKTGGRLVLNVAPDGTTKAAEAELLEWAKHKREWHGAAELVRMKEEPALAEIQKYCAALDPAPIPPGMHWEDEDPYGKLDVKPAGSALAKVTK